MKKNIFVFDVESISLHGSGFAVGAIVLDVYGNEVDRFELLSLEGKELATSWVQANVLPSLSDMPTCQTDRALRDAFFEFYMKHKETCEIWSDVNFPVETNFLAEIVMDNIESRMWQMPYPLKDISTLIDVNIDRVERCGVKGLRKHNPLDDAIASAYCLLNSL